MSSGRLSFNPNYNLTGSLLVAAPGWSDGQYQESVCLVVHHSAQGAVGVMLNRPLPCEVTAIWQLMGQTGKSKLDGKVYMGGPDSGPVVAMHQREELAEFSTGEGVFFAAQIDHLKALLTDPKCDVRIYAGQVVWDAGVLDQQFDQGFWLPLGVSPHVVFEQAERMWPAAMRQIGDRVVQNLVGVVQAPADISVN
jgi:putative transcriptional regulator